MYIYKLCNCTQSTPEVAAQYIVILPCIGYWMIHSIFRYYVQADILHLAESWGPPDSVCDAEDTNTQVRGFKKHWFVSLQHMNYDLKNHYTVFKLSWILYFFCENIAWSISQMICTSKLVLPELPLPNVEVLLGSRHESHLWKTGSPKSCTQS